MKIKLFAAAVVGTLGALTGAAPAHDFKLGDLAIEHPSVRATPPNAVTGAGYVTIRNSGTSPDRLVGVEAGFAARVEIHETAMQGNVMRMRRAEGGLEIPPGGAVTLAPGGYHLMFIGLGGQLRAGDRLEGVLLFEKAGAASIEFAVEGAPRGPAHGTEGGSPH